MESWRVWYRTKIGDCAYTFFSLPVEAIEEEEAKQKFKARRPDTEVLSALKSSQ